VTQLGVNLPGEMHGPDELVDAAVAAEAAGLDFVVASDHYLPWIEKQGDSPFVWGTLGGIARETDEIGVGTAVTCPIARYHPGLIAQAAATAGAMLEGRFFLGVGTGERLNEHVFGDHWPPHHERVAMLEEAVEVIRDLWAGDTTSHDGEHYTVENARVFTLPDDPPPIYASAMGPKTATAVGRFADGLVTTEGEREFVERFREHGEGPAISGAKVCWGESDDAALETAVEWWRNVFADVGGSELPTPTHFEEAASSVEPADAADQIPHGPDPEPYLQQIREFEERGYDRVYFHHLGPDPERFVAFCEAELVPEVD